MLRYLTAGESHGKWLIAILEGLPAGLKVEAAFINVELRRRQQGFGRGRRNGTLLYDSATATEIILQTEKYL